MRGFVVEKGYIGDGVYVEMDQYGDLVLTTEDGISVTNRIILEPGVWRALVMYAEHAQRAGKEASTTSEVEEKEG